MPPTKLSDGHGGDVDFITDSIGHHVWRFWPRWLAFWLIVPTLPGYYLMVCLTNPICRS